MATKKCCNDLRGLFGLPNIPPFGFHVFSIRLVKIKVNEFYVGLALQSHQLDEEFRGSNQGWFLRYDGYFWSRNKYGSYPINQRIYDGNMKMGDTVSIKVDMDKKQIAFFLNGAQLGSGTEKWFSLYLNVQDMTLLRPVVLLKADDEQVEIY